MRAIHSVRVANFGSPTVVLILVLLLSPAAWAQQASGIAGVARDTLGGVLPGVTVEASSPVLIEQVRTVFTDGQGRYNIVDLRPGTYAVTFSLAGFNALRREGITLSGGFTATVNADLSVGSLEETVTVTGASPLVDVQNTRTQSRISNELLDALPSGTKALVMLQNVTPGVFGVVDVGGSTGAYRAQGTPQGVKFHGRTGMKVTVDGMPILNMAGDGNTSYIMNSQLIEEMALESGGVSAESASSGFASNGIPKEGSNTFAGTISGLYSNESLQSKKVSDALLDRGVTTLDKVLNIYDSGVTFGGPIMRDRLWFFASVRAQGVRNQNAGIWYNKTQGTPVYTPDLDRPGDRYEYDRFYGGRVTWQASERNKVNVLVDVQNVCKCRYEGFQAPEAIFGLHFWPQGLYQASWTSPLSDRLLLEAGVSVATSSWPVVIQPESSWEHVPILELSTGFGYNANGSLTVDRVDDDHFSQRFSLSYVTGSHSFKVGVQVEEGAYNLGRSLDHKVGFLGESLGNVRYRFFNGVPNSLTQYATPSFIQNRVKADLGLYVQDQWAVKRFTLNYGLRFDYYNGYVPEQNAPAGQYVPAREFAAVSNVPAWTDLNPRLGVSYDLFGDSRTALKLSMGRYLSKEALNVTNSVNPFTTTVTQTNRTWNDTNGNFSPDCNLQDPTLNGECGALQNANFGLNNPRATRYDDAVLQGFGTRESNWDLTTEVQHELLPGVSIRGGYYRNWHSNFSATDNLQVTDADFDPYCITAPVDARLPGGGGHEVCGLYDVVPGKFGRVSNLVSKASEFGKRTFVNDFFGINVDSRFGSGALLGGGVDFGRTIEDACFVIDSPQDLLYCRVITPFAAQAQLKLHGSYPLPGDFTVSGVFQTLSGPSVDANYPASNAEIAPGLGRNLAACGTRVVCTARATVPLIAPQTLFEGRRTQLDLRVSKFFSVGSRGRLQANIDIYNALNGSSLSAVNSNFGPRWRHPFVFAGTFGAPILNPRIIHFSGTFTF